MGGVVGAIAPVIGGGAGFLLGGPAGAAIGAGLGAGVGGDLASNSAANTQAQGATGAAQIAANAQMQGLQFVQQQEAPYNQAGQQALQRYEQLLGLGGGGSQTGTHRPAGSPAGGGFDLNSFLSSTPGYQFELQQGQNAIENSAAARGGALSGNTLQGELQFGQGLASTQFQQYMSQLAGLTGVGQAAASGVATAGGNLIPGAGASLASGVNAAAQYGAAGQLAGYNQLASGLTTAFNAPSFQPGFQALFGGSSIDPSALAAGY